MIRTGLTLALVAGIADVSIALLLRPEGFSRLTALPAPILALAALVFALFLPAAWLARRAAGTSHRDPAVTSLAVFAGVTLTIALLAGVPLEPAANAHTLYRLVLSLGIGGALGIATFAALGARSEAPQHGQASMLDIATRALPLLALEVLIVEWTAIFQVDPLFSAAGALLAGALGIGVLATLAIYLSAARTRAADWGLAACVVALAATPLASRGWPATGVSVSAPVSAQGGARAPRHIVLISVDTLRADAVSAYRGGSGRPTQAIDALAADGVRFEHAYAPSPWTLPSLVSLVTGVAPSAHHAVGFDARLDESATTLAERLAGRGYYTSAILHNDLLSPIRNLAQGFDDYEDLAAPWFGESLGASLLQRLSPSRFPGKEWPSTADHTQLVIDWLDRNQSRDFFLWVHYLDPHAPYAPPHEYLDRAPAPGMGAAFEGQKETMEGLVVTTSDERRWVRSLYDAEARYVDANVGRIVAALKQRSLYDDALVVFTADHGEEFWEHGSLGHGHSMYQELLQVPLIVKLPASRRRPEEKVEARVVATPVSTVSVTPTVLDVAGVPYGPRDMSAASLVPALDGAPLEPTPIVSTAQMLFDRRETVLFDHYRYIVSTLDGRVELYDHATDPGEQRSIAESSPDLVARGAALLAANNAEARTLARRLGLQDSTRAVDEATLRRLRSLGYVK
ncbi:MAG TPA: sulfatase [Vicinamibacterales bacterium]|jgi:arylsulfatase A-like enzyme|nr:sulfatase [Vicinamibacterales bacterium]